MKIGLLSDTHGYLDPSILEHFASCDEVWHAGDIGAHDIADQLEKFKPFRAVYGNIDDGPIQRRYPEDMIFKCEEMTVLMTHIAGAPPRYPARVKQLLQEHKPDVLVCGHSHILRVIPDKKFHVLYLNPGAAGNQGFHHVRTILRFDVIGKHIRNMEVIELGKRGAIY